MLKYAKVVNEQTGMCEVGTGINNAFYTSIGMSLLDVQQSDIDNNWYLTEKCPMKTEEQKAQEERERINKLTMTALDFIGFLQDAGLTLEQINAYLEANLSVKMQLTYCQNVYCGVAKSLMPITFEDITITADMVELAFRIKNGETIDEDNGTGEASDEDETSSNQPVDNDEA